MIELVLGFVLALALAVFFENRTLRREREQLSDHITRVQRREAGMSETPAPPPIAAAQRPVSIPQEFEELLKEFDSERVRDGLRYQYRIRMAQGDTTPEELTAELRRQIAIEVME